MTTFHPINHSGLTIWGITLLIIGMAAILVTVVLALVTQNTVKGIIIGLVIIAVTTATGAIFIACGDYSEEKDAITNAYRVHDIDTIGSSQDERWTMTDDVTGRVLVCTMVTHGQWTRTFALACSGSDPSMPTPR